MVPSISNFSVVVRRKSSTSPKSWRPPDRCSNRWSRWWRCPSIRGRSADRNGTVGLYGVGWAPPSIWRWWSFFLVIVMDSVISSRYLDIEIYWTICLFHFHLFHYLVVGIVIVIVIVIVPSGKLLHNYGTSPLLMEKLTINCHFQ